MQSTKCTKCETEEATIVLNNGEQVCEQCNENIQEALKEANPFK